MTRAPRCAACGRVDWIDAVDNFGTKYRGCAHCRIVLPREPERVAEGLEDDRLREETGR